MNSLSHWRVTARKVIDRVVRQNPGATAGELRKLVSKAYPFGERKHWPYKQWLREVNERLGPPSTTVRPPACGHRKPTFGCRACIQRK